MQKWHNKYAYRDLPDDFPIDFWVDLPQRGNAPIPRIPHFHQVPQLSYCSKGAGIYSISEKVFTFQAGHIGFINPTEPHSVQNKKGGESTWTYVHFKPLQLLGENYKDSPLVDTGRLGGRTFQNFISRQKHPHLEQLFLKMLQEYREKRPFFKDAIRGYMISILSIFHRQKGAAKKEKSRKEIREMQRLFPAMSYINANFRKKISINKLAYNCKMSESGFRHLFRKTMGKSVYQYIIACRLSMASLDLKEGEKSVETIALDNGFPTLSCFMRKFNDLYGTSPRRWAEQEP